MRIRVFLGVFFIMSLLILHSLFSLEGKKVDLPFSVYTELGAKDNHFTPSGWMGDVKSIKMETSYSNPHSGKTCLKCTYNAEVSSGSGWAGAYWQHPENNWGKINGGYNLSGAKKLAFWARGEVGGEKLEFKVGGLTGSYPDSDIISIGPIPLIKEWKQYEIDLRGADLSYIIGGFVWAASRMDNPDGCIFYLDDITYE